MMSKLWVPHTTDVHEKKHGEKYYCGFHSTSSTAGGGGFWQAASSRLATRGRTERAILVTAQCGPLRELGGGARDLFPRLELLGAVGSICMLNFKIRTGGGILIRQGF